ncbi:hypothetical protein BRADI_4g44214v3 [Brachypodium distachyon]|uniref:Uncharacterized protein n=1 Tax=Brachypodium distachyon TaxID=15368 RepID=A0A0Q3F1S1_BRADI|nr:hypothetical protein BRADI_4g44214v3 [Brachypodium distachyon]
MYQNSKFKVPMQRNLFLVVLINWTLEYSTILWGHTLTVLN